MRFTVAAWRTSRRRERRRGCLPSSPLLRCLATSRLRRGCRVTPPGRRDDVVAAPCSVKLPSTGEGSCVEWQSASSNRRRNNGLRPSFPPSLPIQQQVMENPVEMQLPCSLQRCGATAVPELGNGDLPSQQAKMFSSFSVLLRRRWSFEPWLRQWRRGRPARTGDVPSSFPPVLLHRRGTLRVGTTVELNGTSLSVLPSVRQWRSSMAALASPSSTSVRPSSDNSGRSEQLLFSGGDKLLGSKGASTVVLPLPATGGLATTDQRRRALGLSPLP
nr:hypothetical protein Iba_chr10aCG12840 [Ipomoea batatas]